jgi:spore coat polysaccharide biosynthesis predicted glycosyltransferase SpsG
LKLHDIDVITILGGGNPNYDTLKTRIDGAPFPVKIERDVTDMPGLMAWADVAVSAGGGTVWELLFMGLPNLTVIAAENQRGSVERLGLCNATVNLGSRDDLNPDFISREVERLCRDRARRVEMLDGNRSLVDGGGIERVLSELK